MENVEVVSPKFLMKFQPRSRKQIKKIGIVKCFEATSPVIDQPAYMPEPFGESFDFRSGAVHLKNKIGPERIYFSEEIVPVKISASPLDDASYLFKPFFDLRIKAVVKRAFEGEVQKNSCGHRQNSSVLKVPTAAWNLMSARGLVGRSGLWFRQTLRRCGDKPAFRDVYRSVRVG